MAKNNIELLADFMFEEMERLNDIDLDNPENSARLDDEIKRAKQMSNMSKQIVAAGRTQLEAERFRADYAGIQIRVPKMLEQ